MSLHRIAYVEKNSAGRVLRKATRYVEGRAQSASGALSSASAEEAAGPPAKATAEELLDLEATQTIKAIHRALASLGDRLDRLEAAVVEQGQTLAATRSSSSGGAGGPPVHLAELMRHGDRIDKIEAALAALGAAAEASAERA